MLILMLARIRANMKEVGLVQLLELHLGKPRTRGALTLVPVWNGQAAVRPAHVLRRPRLAVPERAGSPIVGELVVTNGVQASAPSACADLTTVMWDDALVHPVAVNRRHELVPA